MSAARTILLSACCLLGASSLAAAAGKIAPRDDAWSWPPAKKVQLTPIDAQFAMQMAQLEDVNAPMRTGVVRPLPIGKLDPANAGHWSQLADGSHVWRLELHSPGAVSVRVRFSAFDLPNGAKIRIGSADPEAPEYDYKGQGPLHSGEFWSNSVAGEKAYLEYIAEPGVEHAPILEISEVVHTYLEAGMPAAQNVAVPQAYDNQAYCHIDVNCRQVPAIARDSVGRMVYVSGGGQYVCSGALLNDLDTSTTIPWFLTADHCISTQSAASSLEVTWHFQSQQCNGAPANPAYLPKTIGATLVSHSNQTDFALLRLAQTPPSSVSYAGWSTASVGGELFSVHHPGGSYKRYSRMVNATNPYNCLGALPTSRFFYLNFVEGVNEGGSSGSPLFNSSGQVVGQLYGRCGGGGSVCDYQHNAVYGRFSVSYQLGNLGQYLNTTAPGGSGGGSGGNSVDDSFEENDTFAAAKPINPGSYANLKLADSEDYYRIVLSQTGSISISASFSHAAADLDLMLYNASGSELARSDSTTNNESIAGNLAAGTYVLRATRYAGTQTSYTLSIALNTAPFADVNADGVINVSDIALVLLGMNTSCSYGPSTGCPDVSDDNYVSIADLAMVLQGYGLDRDQYNNKAWKREMKQLYNNDVRDFMPARTKQQQKSDLSYLNSANP